MPLGTVRPSKLADRAEMEEDDMDQFSVATQFGSIGNHNARDIDDAYYRHHAARRSEGFRLLAPMIAVVFFFLAALGLSQA